MSTLIQPSLNRHFHKRHVPVLAIGGHDPCGGAGVMADAQAIQALGGWPLTLITLLTAQNSTRLTQTFAQPVTAFEQQLTTLAQEVKPTAIKLGATGSLEIQRCIVTWLKQHPRLPLVIDPVIQSTSGALLCDENQLDHLMAELVPAATLITPNLPELHTLVPGRHSVEHKARHLLSLGCKAVLVTGTHSSSKAVRNQLFTSRNPLPTITRWPRLPHEYHGSGCTLAAAIAVLLGKGETLEKASLAAQDFTWNSLNLAIQLSAEGHHLPLRIQRATHA